ncbi:MAG: hypothetical protein LQ352_002129 [Teloschistes flavicans]|nr:MAG: hypothetical protein LQ352_002129 [Teloschistes flavicans]
MEALSIAASVLGILSVTAKLATGLTELIERGKNVPDSIQSLVSELNDIRGCLVQLQPFLEDTQRSSTSRTAMISLDQVVTINTSCVLTLSELEKFIDSFKNPKSLSRIDRLRWLKNESRVDRILLRIRASKSSLNLILVILTCVSMQEARTAIDSLVPAVEGIRTSSREVSRRLAALEHSAHHLSSIDQQQGNKQHSEIAANTGSARRPDDPGHEPRSGGQDPESLLLFEAVLSTKDLEAIPIVLILNKVDIFMQQIQEHLLREWFPDFVGGDNDWKAAKQYIEARFTAILRDIEDKVMPFCREDQEVRMD